MSLTKDKVSEVLMPEAKGERYYSSNLGWIMTVSAEDMKVGLFNPFKINSQIELPDIKGWPRHFLKKFVLSSSPSWTSDYIVMVLGQCSTLKFCRPGDKQWTSIAIDKIGGLYDKSTSLDDIIYYKGQFFAVGRYGTIFVCDIEDYQQARVRVVVPQMTGRIRSSSGSIFDQIYLVESAGDLLVVSRLFDKVFGDEHDEHRLTAFKVPLSYGKWSLSSSLDVCDLGERTLFISSSNTSISVDTRSNSECRANCMYFTHTSVYDMEHREFEPLRKIHKSLNQRLWIQPSL
ncbi:PREDICTED: putative F-box protein At5g55150 [Fragaria vesca subsp. vesca]|uniref:putative F-box protein At5g55150 n=1 Tax=Fragaria vesca subsp. vesca TaxID=101020 RepID=UPI0002C2F18D|nr:PREDICTED: putative F-box protein At5g55150 [Fragaria vesca subsp. vesca]